MMIEVWLVFMSYVFNFLIILCIFKVLIAIFLLLILILLFFGLLMYLWVLLVFFMKRKMKVIIFFLIFFVLKVFFYRFLLLILIFHHLIIFLQVFLQTVQVLKGFYFIIYYYYRFFQDCDVLNRLLVLHLAWLFFLILRIIESLIWVFWVFRPRELVLKVFDWNWGVWIICDRLIVIFIGVFWRVQVFERVFQGVVFLGFEGVPNISNAFISLFG